MVRKSRPPSTNPQVMDLEVLIPIDVEGSLLCGPCQMKDREIPNSDYRQCSFILEPEFC